MKKLLLIIIGTVLLGGGFVYWEVLESFGWVPQDDWWYTWTGFTMENLGWSLFSIIPLQILDKHTDIRETFMQRSTLMLFHYYCIMTFLLMFLPGWYRYNTWYTKLAAALLAGLWYYFYARPKLNSAVESAELRDKEKVDNYIS